MLARAVTLNMIGQVASLVIGFATSIAIARWLGPADRGLLALMTGSANLALAAAGVGLPAAVMFFASKRDASPGALLGDTLAVGALLGVVLVPLAYVLRGPIADLVGKGHGGRLWALAAVLVPLTFLDWTTHNQLLGKLRFGLYNVLVILAKVATLVVAFVLLGALGLGVVGGILATGAASLVMIGGSLPTLLRLERPRFDGGLLRQMVRYGRRVQVGTIFQLLNYRLDVFILQAFASLSVVGAYVMAEIVAELVITLASSFQQSVLPLVAREEGSAEGTRTATASLRHHGILAVGAIVLNAAFGALVLGVVLGGGYAKALGAFFILLPGMWFLGAGTVVNGNLRGRDRPGTSSLLAGLTVVVTVVLDLLLIPPFGIDGAAVASLCAYVVYGTASLVVAARVFEVPLRELVVPTRADLALYRDAPGMLMRRLRPST